MPVDAKSQETRQRLLEAAGEVFAERGFRGATIREICQRANANVAAVNYHFGDKETLYAAVLKYTHSCAIEKYPPNYGLTEPATAEQRLHAFVRSFLLRLLDKGRPAWHGRLIAREMAEPTRALEELVQEEIRPRFDQLSALVRGLLGSNSNEETVHRCELSVIGQCMFYYHAQPVLSLMEPQLRFETENIEQLAEHITRFSLGALKDLRALPAPTPP